MYERILVGTDGSKTAARAVERAVEVAASTGASLLIMGNKGMTGLTRFFHLGSVPNKVSLHLPCSLSIVKTT